jgi:hypothetical protein
MSSITDITNIIATKNNISLKKATELEHNHDIFLNPEAQRMPQVSTVSSADPVMFTCSCQQSTNSNFPAKAPILTMKTTCPTKNSDSHKSQGIQPAVSATPLQSKNDLPNLSSEIFATIPRLERPQSTKTQVSVKNQ